MAVGRERNVVALQKLQGDRLAADFTFSSNFPSGENYRPSSSPRRSSRRCPEIEADACGVVHFLPHDRNLAARVEDDDGSALSPRCRR
jgi:hypothetical protein